VTAAEAAEVEPAEPAEPPDHTHARPGSTKPVWLQALERTIVDDRDALAIWVLSRISVFVAAAMTGWMFYRTQTGSDGLPVLKPDGSKITDVVPFLDRWAQWDFYHYRALAEVWYSSRPTGVPLEVFFPGFPFTLWLLHGLGIGSAPSAHEYVLAGLIVSAIAGAVAVVALRRLGDLELGKGGGNRAVLLLVLAPPAVFLAAPYTESLFLAFAVPAWLAARRGRWAMAGVLCAGACTVRITGLFLAIALVVEFLTSPRRDWRQVGWIGVAFSTTAAYMLWLWRKTGDPLRWLHAQEEGWHRTFTWPWDSLKNTIDGALVNGYSPDYAWQFRAEIIAAFVGALLTVGLLVWRRWGEATFIGLQIAAFTTSFWFFSVPRSTLLWWPLFIAIAAATMRWRWTLWAYVCVCAPLMIVWVVAYTAGGRWTG
jgi:hypothetical protein